MSEMNEIVKLAVDNYKGRVEKYSAKQANEVLHAALVEANGGKTTLDYRAIRDGKCTGLFTIIEEILANTVNEGLTGDEFFNQFVEYRNVADGDKNEFVVEDNILYTVAEVARGTQGVRRQRLGGASTTSIPVTSKMVRIYEDLDRILAGRVDTNVLIRNVSNSFSKKLLDDIYALWSSVTASQIGGSAYFPTAGAYDEDTLLDLISHVEAAAGGKTATLVGTKKALRNLKESIQGNNAKDELHAMGYYGNFYGTPCVAIPQRHQIGSTNFVLDDNVITVVATDEKPIKVVHEGNPFILMGNPADNADLTQEFTYSERYGLGLVLSGGNSGIGIYEMTA